MEEHAAMPVLEHGSELDRALRSYGEGRISTGKLRELIAEWAAGKPLSPFAEPQGDESFGASARERRLAEYIVAHADDPERCFFCVHDRREHRNGAGPCMHGYDGHVVDCASDCRMYQPDTEYREPAIVTECRAVLASPEAPAKAWVEVQFSPGFGFFVALVPPSPLGCVGFQVNRFWMEEEAKETADALASALGLEFRR